MSKEVVTEEGEEVEPKTDLYEVKLKVKQQRNTAVETVIEWILDHTLRYTQEDMADILEHSTERCARLLSFEPIDEQAVWAAYDASIAKLDQLVMIPASWQKYLDPAFWDLPPMPETTPVRPIQDVDFEALRQIEITHRCAPHHKIATLQKKYTMSEACRQELAARDTKPEKKEENQ